MWLADAFFYLFATLALVCGALVILARNPVHAVLFLILVFFNAAGLFVLLGAEFLAMLLVVVYVGAVAVLFLFVVMMLDVDFAELRAGFIKNAPLGLVVAGVLLAELVLFLGVRLANPTAIAKVAAPVPADIAKIGNTEALGRILYTQYAYMFEAAALVLFVAMIGAIVLTLRHKQGVRRQDIAAQVARNPKTAMEVVKVPSGGYVVPEARGADAKPLEPAGEKR